MALTQNTYTGNGSTVLFSFTFPYLQEADVKVKLNGVTQATTTYSFANATQIQMNTAPANGVSIIIFRDTNNDAKKATFYPGSAIKAEDLNDDFDQILYTAQEVDNNAMSTLGDDPMQGDLSMGNNKLTNLATPTASTDGTNKTYVDSTIDSKVDTAMANDVLAGTDIAKSSSGGQVTISHNVSGADTTVNNSDGNVIQDITITAQGHVTSVGSKNLNDVYYTESELNAGQLDNRYYTETELNAGQLDNRYYTETELLNGALDGRYFTETEADSRYYNLASGEEIQSGETWSAADNKIATTAAIDARIVDLVDDVGGFVPIANETSFPNANPDVNNGAGTLVSIQSLASNLTSSGGGVATISNGTVGNSTVTISGLDASTTYNAGFGMIVETTSTLNTYTFHRLVPKATEVTTVAGNITNINTVGNNNTNINTVAAANSTISTVATNISNVNNVGGSIANVNTVASNINSVNDFSDVYRIASSAPTSHLHEGDLYFDTTANELKIYNGSAWQGGVTATGNLAGLGANTFTGNQSLGDNNEILLGTGNDFKLRHDGTDNHIASANGDINIQVADTENAIIAKPNNSVELYYDNAVKLQTDSGGASINGRLHFGGSDTYQIKLADNQRIRFGSGNDLQLYHDGTNSHLYNATGTLRLRGDSIKLNNAGASENYLVAANGGTVELYYDNSKKFETSAIGATLTGHLTLTDEINLVGGSDGPRFIDSQLGGGNGLHLRKVTGGDTGHENMAKFHGDGNVELYYDNSKKFETTSGGAKVTGTLEVTEDFVTTMASGYDFWIDRSGNKIQAGDNIKFQCGNSADLQIYHDGSHTYLSNNTGNLYIQNNTAADVGGDIHIRAKAGEGGISLYDDASVQLFFDGSKKFETLSGGAAVTGYLNVDKPADYWSTASTYVNVANYGGLGTHGGYELTLTAGGYRKGSSQWEDYTVNSQSGYAAQIGLNPTNGNIVFRTESSKSTGETSGITERMRIHDTGEIQLPDNGKFTCGAANDLQIYHNNHNYIKSTTGDLILQAPAGNWFYVKTDAGNDNSIIAKNNGAVELYYDNSKKIETTSTGVAVTGNLNPAANNTHDLGTSSLRWNNLYVNDMHFSNHPENPNSVDGTWGDWTLQEGEDTIYMLNNRNGKKYKMALTEVS